jgi:hypothetical protein
VRRICAWCGTRLDERAENGEANEPITHGICDSCARSFCSTLHSSLCRFLDSLGESILLVDEGGLVITANACARSALGKEPEGIEGFLAGDVLECAFARLPGGCGRTTHCAACEVRASVTYTFETGAPLCKVEAYLEASTPRGNEKRQLFISTEKVGQRVLLRLDSVRAREPVQAPGETP